MKIVVQTWKTHSTIMCLHKVSHKRKNEPSIITNFVYYKFVDSTNSCSVEQTPAWIVPWTQQSSG